MAQITPEVSEVLERALALSTQDRGLIIDRLIASLGDESAEEEKQLKEAWDAEIKRRVDEIDSGKAKMISMEEFRRRRQVRLRDAGL
jgi:putative addiction module component (TIGR02574 family)